MTDVKTVIRAAVLRAAVNAVTPNTFVVTAFGRAPEDAYNNAIMHEPIYGCKPGVIAGRSPIKEFKPNRTADPRIRAARLIGDGSVLPGEVGVIPVDRDHWVVFGP